MNGTGPGKLGWSEVWRVVLYALIAGLAAFLTTVIDSAAELQLGSLTPFLVSALTIVLGVIKEWLSENRTPPPSI